MALKLFKDKITPSIGDLVRPRMISDMAGIVVEIKDNEDVKQMQEDFWAARP